MPNVPPAQAATYEMLKVPKVQILHPYSKRHSLIFEQNIDDQYEILIIRFLNGSKI